MINISYVKRDPHTAHLQDKTMIETVMPNDIDICYFELNEPTVAIGKSQLDKHIDKEKAEKDGISLITKMTNGTAVYFHDTEIIISMAIGKDVYGVEAGSVVQGKIVEAMNAALKRVGIDANVCIGGSRHDQKPIGCFHAITKNEIEYTGSKLVGVAVHKETEGFFAHLMIYMEPTYEKVLKYIKEVNGTIKPISVHEIDDRIEKKEIIDAFNEVLNEQLSR